MQLVAGFSSKSLFCATIGCAYKTAWFVFSLSLSLSLPLSLSLSLSLSPVLHYGML